RLNLKLLRKILLTFGKNDSSFSLSIEHCPIVFFFLDIEVDLSRELGGILSRAHSNKKSVKTLFWISICLQTPIISNKASAHTSQNRILLVSKITLPYV